MFIPKKIELTDRAVDILSTLRSHPNGLTTVGLYKLFRAAGNIRWKNTTTVSSNIHYLRERDQYISTHGADGGSIHKITKLGLEKLTAAIGLPAEDTEPPPAPKTKTMADLADNIIQKVQGEQILMPDQNSTRIHLESLFDQIRELVVHEMIKIADKPTKLAVLERVSGFVREDDAAWLNRIRADLELMEAE